jgi:hypothetical protein
MRYLFVLAIAAITTAATAAFAQMAPTETGDSAKGKVLTNDKGMTLYVFDKDSGGKSACNGPCTGNWPPLTAAAGAMPIRATMAASSGRTKAARSTPGKTTRSRATSRGTASSMVLGTSRSRSQSTTFDRVALVSAFAAPIGVEVATHFERIELRVGDVDRPATAIESAYQMHHGSPSRENRLVN